MLHAVIFDVDGLLVDNEPIWREAHKSVLAKRGITITEDDVREMAGKGTLEIVELWRKRFDGWQTKDNETVCEEILKEVAKNVEQSAVELPGVTAIIRMLYEKKIPLAVASSSPPFLIQTTLKKLQIDNFIPVIHSGVDEVNAKPAPDVYLSAAKSLGVKPEDCLVFENSAIGVKSAKAANMKCVAVPESPYNPAKFHDADLVVSSLRELNWSAIEKLFIDTT